MMMKNKALMRIVIIIGSCAVFAIIVMVAVKRFAEWRNDVNRQKCIENLRKIDSERTNMPKEHQEPMSEKK